MGPARAVAGTDCGDASMTPVDPPTIRLRVTTATGSVYAILCQAGVWWLRARAVPSRAAPLLPDRWRQIEQPDPWPCGLGDEVCFEFAGAREICFPGLTLEIPLEWRRTTPVREVAVWTDEDEWPGPFPSEAFT